MTNPALRIKATQRPIVAGLSTQLDDHSVAWAKSQRARGIIDALVSATIEGAARLFVRHSHTTGGHRHVPCDDRSYGDLEARARGTAKHQEGSSRG